MRIPSIDEVYFYVGKYDLMIWTSICWVDLHIGPYTRLVGNGYSYNGIKLLPLNYTNTFYKSSIKYVQYFLGPVKRIWTWTNAHEY